MTPKLTLGHIIGKGDESPFVADVCEFVEEVTAGMEELLGPPGMKVLKEVVKETTRTL